MSFIPGQRIADRYRVESVLGEGGMGVVALALDERLGRHVALKLITPQLAGDPGARARLVREARAAAALEHPGIVQVFDAGETEDGGAFLVMELVRGRSLGAWLREAGAPLSERARVIAEAARALGHAHRAGFVHRDVKPDNLMVRDDGRVVLLDLGLAKATDRGAGERLTRLTSAGAFVGTPAYAPPEQILGEAVDGRSDQYSLAVTAYEALVGRLPWSGSTASQVVREVLSGSVPPPRTLRPDLPPALEAALLRALSADPAARFPDVDAFAEALLAVELSGAPEPRLAPPASAAAGDSSFADTLQRSPGAKRRGGRSWAFAAGAGLFAVAAVAAAAWATLGRPAALLASEADRLACPPLEAAVGGEAAGWLGAAAASAACDRAALLLGGRSSRTLGPPELLGLPAEPRDGYPEDPYAEPSARVQALQAAARQAGAGGAWLDGRIEAGPEGFALELTLRDAGGEARAAAAARGVDLAATVDSALARLLRAAEVRLAESLAPEVVPWSLADRLDDALALDAWSCALQSGVGVKEACAALEPALSRLGAVGALVRSRCAEALFLSEPPPAALPEAAGWREATVRAQLDSGADLEALEAAIAAVPESGTALAAAVLAANRAGVAERRGDVERARRLALFAVQRAPRFAYAWNLLSAASYNRAGAAGTNAAMAAWHPYLARPWNELAREHADSPKRRLELERRAALLAPGVPHYGLRLAETLASVGEREQARALAARMEASGAVPGPALQAVLLLIEASETRFGAALKRGRAALGSLDEIGWSLRGDDALLDWTMRVAALLGREAEVADEFAGRFVLGESPRLHRRGLSAARAAAKVCAYGSPEVAPRCLARLRALVETGHFRGLLGDTQLLLEGAEHFAARDHRGAAAAWRALLRSDAAPEAAAISFEALGEHDLAAQVDRSALAGRGAFGNAGLAHVRQARREKVQGHEEQARQLAARIVEAWRLAEEPPAALAEMRTLAGAGH